jgi:protein-disulfide isomerase
VVDALRPREINIKGRPVYGNERAPVTVVVFADFECPHCRQEAPVLRQAIDQFRGRAKLVYKHFPLSGHVRAKAAAIATVAAMEQGKFWEMHDMVFENQTSLEDADIRRFAQKIGLDMAKFDAHYNAKKGQDLVEEDRVEGEKLDISGTPAVFVNGRYMNPFLFGGTITGWIDDALRR